MSNLFSGINARFRGAANKTPPVGAGKNAPVPAPAPGTASSPVILPSSSLASFAPRVPPLPNSPSLAQTIGMDELSGMMPSGDDILNSYHLPRPVPLWLHSGYSKHIVKGNFMTLSARPKTVEPAEWIAHQVVEHYRNLWNFVRVIHEKEDTGSSICNPTSCPRTSAGVNHSFTWLNSRLEPVEVPAHEYMTLMQRWISGKTDDTNNFPTDPSAVSYAYNPALNSASLAQLAGAGSGAGAGAGPGGESDWVGRRSGFPRTFVDICKTIFRQMLRVYSHLYWAHFSDYYHLSLEKQLNSHFCHFVLTATNLDMLTKQELEPMQPLIDLWAANGTFPSDSKAYEYANLRAGERLMQMAGVVG